MSDSQLLSTKKLNDEEFEIKVLNDNREIRIIYMNGDVIILSTTINIIKDTLEDLYDKIRIEIDKVNISGIIVNNYSYKYIRKSINLIDKYENISTLLNENDNKNYIEVSLILGSYLPYIKNIIKNYNSDIFLCIWKYNLEMNNNDLVMDNNILDILKKKYEISFISNLSKLNNDCITSDEYEKIKLYLIKKGISNSVFLLNEIKKYLTIN